MKHHNLSGLSHSVLKQFVSDHFTADSWQISFHAVPVSEGMPAFDPPSERLTWFWLSVKTHERGFEWELA